MRPSWRDKAWHVGCAALRTAGGAVGLTVSWSLPAVAHGDDELHVGSFVGPLLALAVYVVIVGLGRKLIERGGGRHG